MIRHLDFWIGTRLFHPPIIWLCQRTAMTQFAVAAYAWMAAAFALVMQVRPDWRTGDPLFTAVAGLAALCTTITAGRSPDSPRRPSFVFRVMILTFVGLDLMFTLIDYFRFGTLGFRWGYVWDACALVAEYAKTILRIPPRTMSERDHRVEDISLP